MKKLAVVTLEKHTITNLMDDLNYIFHNVIDIDWYYMEDANFGNSINADLILYTSPNYYYMTKDIVNITAEVIIMKRTISREGYIKLINLENKNKAMMVNRTLEMAVETISQLRELGINHIDLVPVYPGMSNVPNLDIAITPDHVGTVPQYAKHIINIGNRKVDISTIMDITAKLNINMSQIEEKINNYVKHIIPISNGLNKIIDTKNELEKALELMVKINDKAIIIMNKDKKILTKNEVADKIFELDDSGIVKDEIYEILEFMEVLDTGQTKKDFIITYCDKNIIVSNYPIIYNNTIQGVIAICEEFNEFERKHQKMKKKLISQGHIAKYTFEDIVFESNNMRAVENKCKKISRIDSTVLILGESGTGKEMFAQAIHNNSVRKGGPFVAINCSNLSSSLLESELFGYEDGAFTGALKGGNKGLFEVAYGGTIFLDEIGEMSINLQAKLLRVLEEREIRRVGGNKVIYIDVRIIAATNKNLRELVDKKLFRDDLYYRLSAFELYIPPLRERKTDIRILIDSFCNECQYFKKISEDILGMLDNYYWPGNVRQLRNTVEYMIQMSTCTITESDLPDAIVEWSRKYSVNGNHLNNYTNIIEKAINNEPYTKEIISCLLQAYEGKENFGRRSLRKKLNSLDVFITENEIRNILLDLEKIGLVHIKKGRSGTRLTIEGYKALKGWKG